MKIALATILISISLIGCESKSEDNDNEIDFVQYDEKKGVLSVNYEKLNGRKLSSIDVSSNSQFSKQSIFLDSNLLLYRISNYKNIYWKKDYENNWISFDKNGLFDFSESYFHETFLENSNDTVYIECRLQKPLMDGNRYVLIGNLSDDYQFSGKVDTFYFNDNNLVKFPDKNAVIGINNIKFIIVEEGIINGQQKKRMIYADKTYYFEE